MSGLTNILAAGSGVLGTLVNQAFAKKNVERQTKYDKSLADYTFNQDLEMWNRGNIYNSPTSQMQRLKSAGLNPNLVYGTGTVAGNQSGQLPKYQAPRANVALPTPNVQGAIMDYVNIKQQNAQTDLINTQRRIAEFEALIRQSDSMVRPFLNVAKSRTAEQNWQEKELKLNAYSHLTPNMEIYPGGGFTQRKATAGWTAGQNAKYQSYVQELAKTNAQIALINAQNEMQNQNIKWSKRGQPIWGAATNALRLFK